MPKHAARVVLHSASGYSPKQDGLLRQLVVDRVEFVGVVGAECERIEDIIDELCVGPEGLGEHTILTSSHPGESLDEVVAFAKSLSLSGPGEVEVIAL